MILPPSFQVAKKIIVIYCLQSVHHASQVSYALTHSVSTSYVGHALQGQGVYSAVHCCGLSSSNST